jgi:hypothetical protein
LYMPELLEFPLVMKTGRRGRVFRASRYLDRSEFNRVELDDGSELQVPSKALEPQPDGSFLFDDRRVFNSDPAPHESTQPIESRGRTTAPPADSKASVPAAGPAASSAPSRSATAPSTTAVDSVEFNEPLFVEDVQVERVPVNRMLDGPVDSRQEGDVTILPVVEEVFTVQRRLLLKEEIRITRRRTEVRQPRRVVVSDGGGVFGADGRPLEL